MDGCAFARLGVHLYRPQLQPAAHAFHLYNFTCTISPVLVSPVQTVQTVTGPPQVRLIISGEGDTYPAAVIAAGTVGRTDITRLQVRSEA